MGTVKQINIENRTYCFYNDIIDLESFDSSLLKLDKKSYEDTGIYNIGYITNKKIGDFKNIYSVNPLYLGITHVNACIERSSTEEINENKYLIFDPIGENKELLKKYNDVFDGIVGKIKETSNDKCDYEKDCMKIKFNSDDDLPFKKPLKFNNITITIRSVFKEDGKLYPQVFLDETLYELSIKKMLKYERIDILEGIDVDKTNLSKECDICHYWYFKDIGFKYEPYLCNGCHDLMQKAMSFNNFAILNVEENAYRIHFWYMSKNDAINIMNGSLKMIKRD